MEETKEHARKKAEELTQKVTSDERWNLQDELMCQVFGFTAYGYIFGIGRVHCFMEVEDIHALVLRQLIGLGIGPKYAEGLIESAHKKFTAENNRSLHNNLIGIGHSHALKEDMKVLIDSIFINAAQIRKATTRPWWKFWS